MTRSAMREALVAMGDLLAGKSKDLTEELSLACDEHAAYVKRFAKRLHERAIREPTPNLPWIALIDALATRRLLVELDHRTAGDDAKSALDTLPDMSKIKGRWGWTKDFDEEELEDMELEVFLEHTGEFLKKSGLTLAELSMDSDAFPLVIVPTARVDELERLAKVAGGEVETFTGSGRREAAPIVPTSIARPPNPVFEWRHFVAEVEGVLNIWSIQEAITAYSVDCGPIGATKYKAFSFSGATETRAAAAKAIDEHLAAGYREISAEESVALEQEAERRKATAPKATATKNAKKQTAKSKPAKGKGARAKG